jgi:Ca2+-dependent lipid-binding protein
MYLNDKGFLTVLILFLQGHDLPAKDSCGTSDPYVKFFLKGKQVHKSKTIFKDLNPFWDEKFTLNIEDPFIPLEIKVGLCQKWLFSSNFP